MEHLQRSNLAQLPAEPAEHKLPGVTDVMQASAQVADDQELATSVEDWQAATYLLIGAILHKHGRRAIDISPRELQKFNQHREVKMSVSGEGTMRYEIVRKKGAK